MIDLTDHSFEHVLKSYLVLIDLLCVLVVFHILCLLYISLRSLLGIRVQTAYIHTSTCIFP